MDWMLFQAINGEAGHWAVLDRLAEFSAAYVPILLGLLLVAAWFTGARPLERARRQRAVIYAIVAAVLGLVAEKIIGDLYYRPRPFVAHHVTQLVAHARDSSMPSSHAIFGFAVAVALVLVSRRLGLLALALAVLMSLARVYVGVHYPGDVTVGALIGGLLALALSLLDPYLDRAIAPALALAKRLHVA
ncbi:MAG TPA: phosphatase PAP2 family protein [Thermomicrobiales bacterium]|nr:phosphatase PAP2 family protein [Thermomicrobiales bacterium]